MAWRCEISLLERLFTEKIIVPLVDYLKDPLVLIRRDWKIEEINSAMMSALNLSGKQMAIGRDFRDFRLLHVLERSIIKCFSEHREFSDQIVSDNIVFNASITPIMINEEISRVSLNLSDITNFVKVERELVKRNRELVAVNAISTAFITAGNAEMVFSDLLDKILLTTDFSLGWLVFKRDNGFDLKSYSGVSLEFQAKLKNGELDEVFNKALQSGVPLFILEAYEMPEELQKEGIMFLSAIPLSAMQEVSGILFLASRADLDFDFDIASLLSLIGNNLSLIAEKIRLFNETERLAITDSLTTLYNVRYFYNALSAEIARSERYGEPFSLILLDVDNFKTVNDTHGHQSGDDILRALGAILNDVSRKSDVVARYGGEEFIMILPNSSKEEAVVFANRVREAVESNSFLDGIKISLSGGVATFPDDAKDSKSILYVADMAMYKAKSAGKNRVCCSDNL